MRDGLSSDKAAAQVNSPGATPSEAASAASQSLGLERLVGDADRHVDLAGTHNENLELHQQRKEQMQDHPSLPLAKPGCQLNLPISRLHVEPSAGSSTPSPKKEQAYDDDDDTCSQGYDIDDIVGFDRLALPAAASLSVATVPATNSYDSTSDCEAPPDDEYEHTSSSFFVLRRYGPARVEFHDDGSDDDGFDLDADRQTEMRDGDADAGFPNLPICTPRTIDVGGPHPQPEKHSSMQATMQASKDNILSGCRAAKERGAALVAASQEPEAAPIEIGRKLKYHPPPEGDTDLIPVDVIEHGSEVLIIRREPSRTEHGASPADDFVNDLLI